MQITLYFIHYKTILKATKEFFVIILQLSKKGFNNNYMVFYVRLGSKSEINHFILEDRTKIPLTLRMRVLTPALGPLIYIFILTQSSYVKKLQIKSMH